MKELFIVFCMCMILLTGCQKLPVQHIIYNTDSIEYKFDIDNSTGFYLYNDSGRFILSNDDISVNGMFINQEVYDYYKRISEDSGSYEDTIGTYKLYFFEHEDVYGTHYNCIITNTSNDAKLMLVSEVSTSDINEVLKVIKFNEEE